MRGFVGSIDRSLAPLVGVHALEHLRPRLAAIARAIDAALAACPSSGHPARRRTRGRDSIGWMRTARDLPRRPRARRASTCVPASVLRYTPSPYDDDCPRTACSPVPTYTTFGSDSATAIAPMEPVRKNVVRDVAPRCAGVLRLPHAAARVAHVVHERLRCHAGDGVRAAAAKRADQPPLQRTKRGRVVRSLHGRGRRRGTRGGRLGQHGGSSARCTQETDDEPGRDHRSSRVVCRSARQPGDSDAKVGGGTDGARHILVFTRDRGKSAVGSFAPG